jgi:hypothetical protein
MPDWKDEWQKHTDNPPKPGEILRAYGEGSLARLDVELVDGKPPFVYGRVHVPCIVGHELGWFLQSIDSDQAHGWKCILLPKAREECLRRCGLTSATIAVKALRVVRASQTGNSLLCEVAEYAPVEATA